MADWSNLFDDLLRVIKQKSSAFLPDFYRFASACAKWRSIAFEKRIIFPPLLLLPFDEATNECCLFNSNNKKVMKFRLPELRSRLVCATSHSWLMTLDEKLDIKMLNIFTKAELPLPSLPCYEQVYMDIEPEGLPTQRAFYLKKVVLSANLVTSPHNCFVACLWGYSYELAFCRLGDDKWTTFSNVDAYLTYPATGLTDVIFLDNKIYAVNDYAHSKIFIYDFGIEHGVDPKLTMMSGPKGDVGGYSLSITYLVESLGELFCIMRYIGFFLPEGCEKKDYKTLKFDVFKLDQDSKDTKWSKIDFLGDRVLFLGANHSFMLSLETNELVNFRRNCIYFTEDYLEGYANSESYGCHDGGVFSLKNGTIELDHPSAHPWPVPPIWLEQRL